MFYLEVLLGLVRQALDIPLWDFPCIRPINDFVDMKKAMMIFKKISKMVISQFKGINARSIGAIRMLDITFGLGTISKARLSVLSSVK